MSIFNCQFLLGILVLLGSFAITTPASAAPSLYNLMREVTQKQFLLNDASERTVEPVVKSFIRDVYVPEEGELTSQDIDSALRETQDICTRLKLDSVSRCPIVRRTIQDIAERETRVRSLGRDLQIIAASQWEPLMGLSDPARTFPSQVRGIVRMWRAGTADTRKKLPDLRIQTLTSDAALNGAVTALGQELERMHKEDPDAFTAAVWRYLYGYRYVTGERGTPYQPDVAGTDAGFLSARWPAIEEKLFAIQSLLPTTLSPALASGEVAFFELPASLQSLLPDNVVLWAYHEKIAGGTALDGDVGLGWQYPLDPVLPMLCDDDEDTGCAAVRGGFYPASAEDGGGLCSHPLARLGYLCTPITPPAGEECKTVVNPSPDKIILTSCTDPAPVTQSESGPDACMGIDWNPADKQFDAETQCTVNLRCGANDFDAQTFAKKADGSIDVVVGDIPTGPPAYLFIHELVHAKQQCGSPPNTDFYNGERSLRNNPVCCRLEGEAYRAQCEAMAADGIFDGEPIAESDGSTPLNAETCAQILTDFSCQERGFGACAASFTFHRSFEEKKDLAHEVVDLASALTPDKIVNNVGEERLRTCQETLESPRDPRIDGAKNALSTIGREVCSGTRATSYQNTIGGNVCFLDRCLEETFQNGRLVPGRASMGTADGSFPFDACIPPKPDFASLTHVSPTIPWTMPPFRPALLFQALDLSLCPGLPPLSPPVLCGFDQSRRLQNPLSSLALFGLDSLEQRNDRQDAVDRTNRLSEPLGVRIGTRLYAEYFSARGSALNDLAREAAELLTAFTQVSFPRAMCPANETDLKDFIGSEFCPQ